jgi:tetratricopeptide (TPR) repeat protein
MVTAASSPRPASGSDPVLGELFDEIATRLQAGEAVDLEGYVRDHPEQAERLRQLLPAMEVLAGLGRSAARGEAVAASLAAPVDLPCGDLGDFRIVGEVGRGGMGVVYEAEQISLHRRVALKVLPFAATLDPRHLQRFHNEAQAAAGLHHTNIVPVYAVGCERGMHFYAMQFIDGQSLAALIHELRRSTGRGDRGSRIEDRELPAEGGAPTVEDRGGRNETLPSDSRSSILDPRSSMFYRTVARLGEQAAQALEHAHQLGVVHRDIKPANLLIQGEPGASAPGVRLWVTDFGLAHCQSQVGLTLTGHVVGTLRYMSPEQALGKPAPVDPRMDVYSLGVTLYELLTLEPAYAGQDREELLRQIAFEEPTRPRRRNPDIPVDLETIVLKATAKELESRYATAQELADDLRRFLEDRPIQARRTTLLQRVRKWSRRHRAVVRVLAAAALVLAVAGGIGAWWLGGLDAEWRAAANRAREGAEGAVGQAAALQRQGRFAEAEAVLVQALSRLGAEGPADVRQRLEQARSNLLLVKRLEDIRLRRTVEWKSSVALAAAYKAVFREQGLDLAEEPATLARRVAASPVRQQLVDALDDWARAAYYQHDRWTHQRLLAVAQAADPDRWRDQMRDPKRWRDRKALEQLAAREEVEQWSPPLLVILADQLENLRGNGVGLLVKAQGRHPDDFWLNFYLGLALSKRERGRPDEAVGYYRAALAARPETPAVYNNLGLVLEIKGDLAAAMVACRKATELDPKYALAHNTLGDVLNRKEDWTGAVIEFRRAMELDARLAAPHVGVGIALQAQRRLEAAIAAFEKAIELDPKYALAYFGLGNARHAKGDLAQAIAAYHKAIGFDPKYAPAHHSLGLALAAKRDWQGAINAFQKVIELNPKNAPAHYNLGNALKANGDLAGAIAAYRKAIDFDPKDAKAHYDLGSALHDKGDLAGAIAAYRKAIDFDPKDAPAHYNLGNALRAKGDLGGAITAYHKAIKLDPKFARAQNNLGTALKAKGDLAGAIAAFRKAIKLDPKYALAHRNLGVALEAKGERAAAIAAYQKAIDIDPKDAKAQFNLGYALNYKGDLTGAIAAYHKAIELDPKDAKAHHNLGLALAAKHEWAAAIAAFKKAIELNPNEARPHNNLGNALEAQGDLDGAIAAHKKAIELDPMDPRAHHNLGVALAAKHEWAAAIAAYKKAVELDPKDAKRLFSLGNALRGKKDLDGAIAAYKKALELAPKYALAYFGLGVTLADKRDWPGAIAAYRMAIEIVPNDHQFYDHLGTALFFAKHDLAAVIDAYRKAIQLKPQFAPTYCRLSQALFVQGRFAEGCKATRRALELLGPSDPFRTVGQRQLRLGEQLLRLDAKLSAFLKGEAQPSGAAELLGLADFCRAYKKRHALAARFYAKAFAADAQLAADLRAEHRYNAACAAGLAAAGQGEDADSLGDAERVRLRQQALRWLQDDLAALRQQADKGTAQARASVPPTLQHWQHDPDLGGLRDQAALANLPVAERAAWRKLWGDVNTLLNEVQKRK